MAFRRSRVQVPPAPLRIRNVRRGIQLNRQNSDFMTGGRRWTVHDRYGNEIHLTHERWEHIIEPISHPEMAAYEEHLTVQFDGVIGNKTL